MAAELSGIARTVTAGGVETAWTGDDGEGDVDVDVPDKPASVLSPPAPEILE